MIINGFGGKETPSSTVQRIQLSTSTVSLTDPYTNTPQTSLSPQSSAGWINMSYFNVTTIHLDDYISSGCKSFSVVPVLNSVTGGVFTGQNTNSHSKLGVNPWQFEFTPCLSLTAQLSPVNFSSASSSSTLYSNRGILNVNPTSGQFIQSNIAGFAGFIKTNTVPIASTSSGAWTTYNVNNFTQTSVTGTLYGGLNTFFYKGRLPDGTNIFTTAYSTGSSSYSTNYYNIYYTGTSDIEVIIRVRGYQIKSTDAQANTGSSAINIRYYYDSTPATTSPTFNVTTYVYGVY